MKCLAENCNNEFESKTGRKKFCSNACKMRYFRKHGKKDEIKPYQLQAILKQIGDLAFDIDNKLKLITPISEKESLAIYNATQFTSVEKKQKPTTIIRSAEQWHEIKRTCESAEEWAMVKFQILEADNLSQKQKQLIINTP